MIGKHLHYTEIEDEMYTETGGSNGNETGTNNGAIERESGNGLYIHRPHNCIVCILFLSRWNTDDDRCLYSRFFLPENCLRSFRGHDTRTYCTMLNIVLIIPLGFFLPLLYKKYDSLGKIALVGFLVSLSIEIAQMFGTGATDINDLITNTVGACFVSVRRF